jgi:hypothetical protein
VVTAVLVGLCASGAGPEGVGAASLRVTAPAGRAYEQSSPVDKEGDALGKIGLVKAADSGGGVSFSVRPGKSGEALPFYLALRGTGESGWATQDLLPPPVVGERTEMQGWLPDFSEAFSREIKLGTPRLEAFVSRSTGGSPAAVISPYTADAKYSYVGASLDASTVVFEAQAKLAPEEGDDPIEAALDGASNLYAWDRASGRLSLASVRNDGTAPPKGAFAGPYDWSAGTSARTLRDGGAARDYYLQGSHAVTASGDVYFTEAGTGQLYLRLRPTQPQSPLDGEGKCTDAAKACTIHVSASQKNNGRDGGPDPAGAQPAAFQAASADGSEAFFTSPEKLTNDANTGPEQPAPEIVRSDLDGENTEPKFIPKRAVGVAVDGSHVYWADPVAGTIGRAALDGSQASVEDAFIAVGASECEEEVEPGVLVPAPAPSKPRYVAVDSGHVYWTNTGKLDQNGEPEDRGGTIGRADIDGSLASIDPDFICGASSPQGIAVNSTHIYWANAAKDPVKRSVARATIGGDGIEQEFFPADTNRKPYGVALSASHVYFSLDEGDVNSYGGRVPLAGGQSDILFIGSNVGVRGVAVDGTHVYWATQGEDAIGRANLALEPASRETEFVRGIEGELNGLAVDASHIYWSVNGESPSNPGNDLYRYRATNGELTDLTPDSSGENGAEVQGVLGASESGSHLYFAANGDLDGNGPASPGDCQTQGPHGSLGTISGSCSLYLWHEGTTSFIALLDSNGAEGSDSLNWVGTPSDVFATSGYFPRTAFVSKDGQALLFRSQEKLTEYDNEGIAELYRYSAKNQAISCVSCPPGGTAVGEGPSLGSIKLPGLLQPTLSAVASVASHNLSTDGNRVFFETAEALVPGDANGQVSCPGLGLEFIPACLDVYEWEAPDTGACTEGDPAYSALNEGCIYLISTGEDPFPSHFADASGSGSDVFFFTRQQLVGQDKDELQDVYDARVGGGLASQNPVEPPPCPNPDACNPPTQTPSPAPPPQGAPPSASPPMHKHAKHKAKKKRKKKHRAHKHKKRKKAHFAANRL